MNRAKINHDNFFAKVEITADCWLWRGSRNTDGYGLFGVERKVYNARQRELYHARKNGNTANR